MLRLQLILGSLIWACIKGLIKSWVPQLWTYINKYIYIYIYIYTLMSLRMKDKEYSFR